MSALTATASPVTTSRTKPPLWLVLTAFLAVYVIWGSTYLGIHIAIQTMPPLLMAGSRFVLAGVFLYAVMRARGGAKPTGAQWLDATVIGALLLLGGNGGVSWAQQFVPSGVTALVVAATPLWMILIDWLRPSGDRPRGVVFLGLALGFAGVALIAMSRDAGGQRLAPPIGIVVLLLATMSWATGSVFSRHARKPQDALLAIGMQMIAGGGTQLLAGTALGELPHLHPSLFSQASILAFAYLTVFGSLVGFTAYVWLLQVSTPARVATYAYVNPFIAVLLGWLVLDEPLPHSVLLAGALILGAVILITVRQTRRRA